MVSSGRQGHRKLICRFSSENFARLETDKYLVFYEEVGRFAVITRTSYQCGSDVHVRESEEEILAEKAFEIVRRKTEWEEEYQKAASQ